MLSMLIGTVILGLGLAYFRLKRGGSLDPMHPMQSFDREWPQEDIPEPTERASWPKA